MKKELEDLVVNNLGLVYDVINKHKSRILQFFEYEDAVQIGTLGLINAANTFDETRQVAFSTYAYTCIKLNIAVEIKRLTRKRQGSDKVILSLDALIVGNDDFTLMYYLEDDINVAEEVADNGMIKLLYKYIDELDNDLQRQIMQLRLKDKTFEQIADILTKPPSVIYANYQKALNKLRYKFREDRNE